MRANVGNLAEAVEDNLVNGRFEVECVKVEHTVSDQKGTEGTTLFLKILDGPETDTGEPSQGQRLITTLWWGNAQMKDGGKFSRIQMKKACEAAGVQYDETGFEEEDFVGNVFAVKVKISEYEGETRPEVKAFYPA